MIKPNYTTNEASNKKEEEIIKDSSDIETFENWDELDIDPFILRGIYSKNFEKPSPIQKQAIKSILSGRDLIAQAQSGTGKTGTFAIGALSKINLTMDTTQVLILSPTRELTQQTSTVISEIGSMMKGLKIQTYYGGQPINNGGDFSNKNTPHIICGCTGRVYDMLTNDKINPTNIKLLILDEADEMLSFGFKEQVYNVFQYLPENVQILLFSATFTEQMYTLTNKFMRNPIKISVKSELLTLDGIKQYYVAVDDDRAKYNTIKQIYPYLHTSQSIIYCNSIKRVIDLHDAMVQDEFPVCCIHSNMDKKDRDASFLKFKNGASRVLISSNVTARGIDIQQVSVVINFDLPKDAHTYLHRIGRSGRWGRKGLGINFTSRRDTSKIEEIETYYGTQISEMPADLSVLQI